MAEITNLEKLNLFDESAIDSSPEGEELNALVKSDTLLKPNDILLLKRELSEDLPKDLYTLYCSQIDDFAQYIAYKVAEVIPHNEFNYFHWEFKNEDFSQDYWDPLAKDMYNEIISCGLDEADPHGAHALMMQFKHDMVTPEFYTAYNSAKKVPRKCRVLIKNILLSKEEDIDWASVAKIPENLDNYLIPYVDLIPAGELVDFYYECAYCSDLCEDVFDSSLQMLQVDYWKHNDRDTLQHLVGIGKQYFLVLRNLLDMDESLLIKCCNVLAISGGIFTFTEAYTLIHNYFVSDFQEELKMLPVISDNDLLCGKDYYDFCEKFLFSSVFGTNVKCLGAIAVLLEQCHEVMTDFEEFKEICQLLNNIGSHSKIKYTSAKSFPVFMGSQYVGVIKAITHAGISLFDLLKTAGGIASGVFNNIKDCFDVYNIEELRIEAIAPYVDDSCLPAVKDSIKRIIILDLAGNFNHVSLVCSKKVLELHIIDILKRSMYGSLLRSCNSFIFTSIDSVLTNNKVVPLGLETFLSDVSPIFEFEFWENGKLRACLPIDFLPKFLKDFEQNNLKGTNSIQKEICYLSTWNCRLELSIGVLTAHHDAETIYHTVRPVICLKDAVEKFKDCSLIISEDELRLYNSEADYLLKSIYYQFCIRESDPNYKVLWNRGSSGVQMLNVMQALHIPGENLVATILRWAFYYNNRRLYCIFCKRFFGYTLNGSVKDILSGKEFSVISLLGKDSELQTVIQNVNDFDIEAGVLYVK